MNEPGEHFRLEGAGIAVSLSRAEIDFLADAVELLEGLGDPSHDAGAARLNPPVYLGDPEADDEWRRFAGGELRTARRADRNAFESVLDAADPERGSPGEVIVTLEQAASFLRVLNETRLVLAARWGVDTPEDFEVLRPEATDVLSFLGWLLTEVSEVLGEAMDRP